MTQKTNPWTFDVRVRERNLKSGSVTEKDVDKYLAGLPDLADQSEAFGTSQPALAQPPAPPPPPSLDDIDDDEDEDEDEADEVVEAAPVAAEPEREPEEAPAVNGTVGGAEPEPTSGAHDPGAGSDDGSPE